MRDAIIEIVAAYVGMFSTYRFGFHLGWGASRRDMVARHRCGVCGGPVDGHRAHQ